MFCTWRDLRSKRINDLAVCKCCTVCVNLHTGAFQVHIRLLAKFEFTAGITNTGPINVSHNLSGHKVMVKITHY